MVAQRVRDHDLETGKGGGSNLRKLEGGAENFEFPGAPEIHPFLQRFFLWTIVDLEVTSPSLRAGDFRGASGVRYVLTPPIPVSE